MTEQDEQIERIKQKMVAKGWSLQPCEESYVESFEETYGVRLPEGYRRFLLEISDQLLIPDSVQQSGEDLELQDMIFIQSRCLRNIQIPFPFQEVWAWENENWERAALEKEMVKIQYGNLLLTSFGCAMYAHLIVTGAERGKVWDFSDVGIGSTNLNYLDWWEMVILDGKNPYDMM